MEPAILSAIVISVGSLLVALVTTRQNRQGATATNALSERVVDRDDFKEVMDRMNASLARSDERIAELEKRLETEVEARKDADRRAVAAELRAVAAEQRADRLEKRVTQLEKALEDNNIPVPPIVS